MRIAIVTETFLPSTDGIVTRLSKAIDYFCRQGHKVLVIAPDIPGIPNEYKGALVQGAPTIRFFMYKERPWAVPSRKIKKYLQDFQPDIVHAVNPASLTASAIYYAKKLTIPLICSFHTNLPDYTDRYHVSFVKPVLWNYLRYLHNQAPYNLVTSKAMYDLLNEQGIHGLQILPKGVDLEMRHPRFKSQALRDKFLGKDTNKKLFLFVGRLAQEKEIDQLKVLFDLDPQAVLVIVGDGPYRANLEDHFQGSSTYFTGFQHGEDLAGLYASADAFVFPSRSETLGLVLTEAMAAGIPVIAASSAPTEEQITHQLNGLIYDPDEPETLAECLKDLDNQDLRQRLIDNGLLYAQGFSWDHASQAILDAYQLTLDNYQ